MIRANRELIITFQALHAALGMPESVNIVGNVTDTNDTRRGQVRLLVIDTEKPQLQEGTLGMAFELPIISEDVKQCPAN